MPSIAKQDAVEQLRGVLVRPMPADELAEYYNELFPQQPTTVSATVADQEGVRRRVLDYFQRGLEPEEVVDLWNVAYPAHSGVYYDESDGRLRYDEDESSSSDDDEA